MVVLTVGIQLIVGFLLALMFEREFPGRRILLMLVLTPMMLSFVAVGAFFRYYYEPTFGLLSQAVRLVTGEPYILLASPEGAIAGIVFADAWMWSPFVMLLVLAGLVSVPKYLYEAAEIDRASWWRRFPHHHLALYPRLLLLALLFRTIEAFKLFDVVFLITEGGPGTSTETIAVYLYRVSFQYFKTAESSALAYILIFIVIVLTTSTSPLLRAATRKGRGGPGMKRRRLGHAGWGWTAFAGLVSFIYFFPVLWIVLTAFKAHTDALAIPPKWIFTPTLENFVSVFARAYIKGQTAVDTNFDVYFFNSIFIAGSSVLIALVIGTLAAYGFSRYPLRGNSTYLFIILTTRMLPPIVVIIPIFLMFRVSGLSGTYLGVILLYTAFNLPFTIWMMKSFFDELSPEVEDAARLDGSNGYRVFFRICMPQVKAGLAATAVFGLILTWNEFLFALLLTGVETRTVPVAMAQTIGGDIGVRWGLLAAIETLFLIPVVVVVYVLQNHLLRGVTFGTIRR